MTLATLEEKKIVSEAEKLVISIKDYENIFSLEYDIYRGLKE